MAPIVVIVHIVTVHIIRCTSVGIGIGDVATPCILYDLLIDGSHGAVVEVEPSLRMKVLNVAVVVVIVIVVDDDDDSGIQIEGMDSKDNPRATIAFTNTYCI